MAEALDYCGLPIIFGGITTTASLFPVSFSKSNAFKYFFRCIFLVMVFAMTTALIVLPIVLSIIGPSKFPPENDKRNEKESTLPTELDGGISNKITYE